jgi:hypothetical protein
MYTHSHTHTQTHTHSHSIAGVTPGIFGVWALVEPVRLYIGYAGNLDENVPSLIAFEFLSLFPQSVLCVFLLALQKPLLPFDQVRRVCVCIC